MDINELSNRIYAQNVELGWWDNPRSERTIFMLIISEIAEAMEGARKQCPDDKLPHRPMLEVELADVLIRCCDMIAFEQTPGQICENQPFVQKKMEEELNRLRGGKDRRHIAEKLYDLCYSVIQVQQCFFTWERCIAELIHVCDTEKLDLVGAVEEKIAFNRTRVDHKRENREKQGGKKW